MNRALTIAGLIPVSAAVWIVAASALFCKGIGRSDLFVFPFLQWVEFGLPYWHANWWIKLWVCAGGLIPLLFLVSGWIGLIGSLTGRKKQPNLYGSTGWASPAEMRQGGIKLEKDIF